MKWVHCSINYIIKVVKSISYFKHRQFNCDQRNINDFILLVFFQPHCGMYYTRTNRMNQRMKNQFHFLQELNQMYIVYFCVLHD